MRLNLVWRVLGSMTAARSRHAVYVVSFDDYVVCSIVKLIFELTGF